ncbi:zinc ribbon domain-containing protein [Methanoregula sp. UBA64]|jgi:hypothetical protein|uniref:zinc ribbon domain-containing protein n=1 Tax=Methanoregula sp. UBA64 TaxID=1915554 RepID=UPI0025E1F081|nr:zinc ribbon domain-containing protein [Methanoregula sp. UBA64]
MDDPALQGDEQILIRTQGVHVKSISFEGILTTRRIILVDRIKGVLPPKEIPLSTIQSVEPGENAIRDQVIALGVITRTGGARQMVLTFSREGGGNRAKERDEWVRQIEAHLGGPSFEPVAQPAPVRSIPPQYGAPGAYAPSGYPAPAQPRAEPPTAMPAPEPAPAPQETILGTYCTKCGTKVPENSAFCNKCGTRIMRPGETAPAAAPAPAAVQKARPVEREMQSVEPLMERSTVSAPRDPLRTPPQAPPARPYTAPTPVAAPPATPAAHAAPAPAKKEKRRFMPKLFSPKDLPPTPLVQTSAKPPAPKKPSNKKKILLIAGVVIVLLVVVVGAVVVLPKTGLLTGLFHGSTSSGSSGAAATATVTAKTTSSAGSAAGVVAATLTPVSVPQSGVFVYVNYIGGWKGTYGTANETFKATNSGERIMEVVNATGPVSASFGKQDGSSHGLTVTIYKNGKALTTGTSTAANGQVTLSVDTVTGVAQQPVVSGGNSAAVTTTVAAATNTTVKTTTSATANVTAAKTTAK